MEKIIESLTPPKNTQVMWLDVSQEVKQLKAYVNGEWVVVNIPKIDDTIDKKTAVPTAEGKWMSTYDAEETRAKKTFLAAPVESAGKSSFREITMKDLPDEVEKATLDTLTYGVSWSPLQSDPVLTRVGNMNYHKTLPIQNGMKGCIVNPKLSFNQIRYYLDPTDWRFISDNQPDTIISHKTILKNETVGVIEEGVLKGNSIVSEKLCKDYYIGVWLKINNKNYIIMNVAVSGGGVYFISESVYYKLQDYFQKGGEEPTLDFDYLEAGTYDIEVGAILNGYEGEVMVEVPEFWIKAFNPSNSSYEVRISPTYIDDTWEHQPSILVSAYAASMLRQKTSGLGYLSLLPASSLVSCVNTTSYCRGGNNSKEYDGGNYNGDGESNSILADTPYKTLLCKPVTALRKSVARNYARNANKELLNYHQYKRIFYWLYVIEYANFNCQAPFNPELTAEGFKQGGLGDGVTTVNGTYGGYYNKNFPLTPNGYTNELGNGTGVKAMKVTMPTNANGTNTIDYTLYVPRWHGIENPFGDRWIELEGIVCTRYDDNVCKVLATEDPAYYNEEGDPHMKVIGYEYYYYDSGYIDSLYLGEHAEIIPVSYGGSPTTYMCDGHITKNNSYPYRRVMIGGDSYHGSECGIGYFRDDGAPDMGSNTCGFRVVYTLPD